MKCLLLQATGAKSPTLVGHNYLQIQSGSTKITKLSSGNGISTCSHFHNLSLNFKSKPFLVKCQVSDLASAAYGTLLLSGGIFAFNKSRSKGSLFGGLTGAALMTAGNKTLITDLENLCFLYFKAYFLMQQQETRAVGDAIGFGSAFLFSSVFGIRLAATRKLIPSGPLLALSICALVVFISSYFQDTLQ